MRTTLLITLAFISAIAQTPVIRVPVRLVAVPTAVTSESGQLVRGLRESDFKLFDNDNLQRLHLDYAEEPLSIAIVIQANDSARTWLPGIRRAVSTIEALLIGATGEASVSTFGDEVRMIQSSTGNTALLDKAFGLIKPSGENGNCMLDAVLNAAKHLEQAAAERRRIILLIAQSGDTGSHAKLSEVLQELEFNNIALYSLLMPRFGKDLVQKTVSVRDVKSVSSRADTGIMGSLDLAKLIPEIFRTEKSAAGEDELSVITSETGGRRIPFRKLSDLEKGVSTIGVEIHTEYVLSYAPNRDEGGYHRIRVQINRPNVLVRARPGYYIPPDTQH